MQHYILRRLLVSIPVLFGVTLAAFMFVRLLPGDPAVAILGERATPATIEAMRRTLGLDLPIWQQYADYLARLAVGDLGNSTITSAPVAREFAARFPATLELSLTALVLGVTMGLLLGKQAAKRPGSLTDGGLTVLSLLGVSIPIFVLGPLLQYVFGAQLQWLPTSGRVNARLFFPKPTGFLLVDSAMAGNWTAFRDVVAHLVLPAITLAMMPMAMVARMVRTSVIEVRREDFVRTAVAKGVVRSRIDRRHVMRNAWLPVTTIIGLQVGTLLAGTVITETVFSWNGVGSLVVNAINQRDYFMVQSSILLFALIFIVVNLAVDLSYAVLDPRIRYA